MPDSAPVGDLVAAVAGASSVDRPSVSAMAADARQRSKARMLDALQPATLGRTAADRLPAPVERPMPRPRRDRAVEITFQDGRRVRAKIAPAVARRSDLSAVARTSAVNNRRAFKALHRQRRAIKRLRRSQDDLARKIDALAAQKDRAVVDLAQGLAGLARRLREVSAQTQTVAVATGVAPAPPTGGGAGVRPPRPVRPAANLQAAKQLQRQQLRQLEQTKLLAVRTQIHAATGVVNSVQAAAYGQRGSILAKNNLVLAGTQLFWSLLDPVLQSTGVVDAKTATVLAAFAPIGSLLTGEVVLGNQQHVRFLSGVETVDANGNVVLSLRDQIAEGFWPTFRQRTDVLVTARVVEPVSLSARPVVALVNQGTLVMHVRTFEGESFSAMLASLSISGPVRVAWTVDIGADVG